MDGYTKTKMGMAEDELDEVWNGVEWRGEQKMYKKESKSKMKQRDEKGDAVN